MKKCLFCNSKLEKIGYDENNKPILVCKPCDYTHFNIK